MHLDLLEDELITRQESECLRPIYDQELIADLLEFVRTVARNPYNYYAQRARKLLKEIDE